MKKFSVTVDGKEYQVIGESLETIEMWLVEGMPKIWSDNLASIVETDMTEQIIKRESFAQKRALFDSLIANEDVLDNLIADLQSRKGAAES